MKQGRLSFSTKRKDRVGEVEDVILIGDDPETPPTKKVCRTSLADSESSPPKPKQADVTKDDVKQPEFSEKEPTERGDVVEKSEKLEKTPDVDSDKKETGSEEESDDAGEKVMDVSIAESSILDSTIESIAAESEADEKSDASTPNGPKRARLSKTEAAFRSLKQRKDKELRQKEKDEKLKLKQEEKERREQERKELRDRKEKERLEKEKKKEEERLERERKKEEERLQREKERIEKEKKKEEERLLREKERLEKEKKKEEERLQKEKERLEKEKEKEEKEKLRKEKEDEKRRREEEKKRELEEESAKKEKAKQAFISFFVKRRSASNPDTTKESVVPAGDCANDDESNRSENPGQVKFKPFQLKQDMKLAPIVSEEAKSRFDKSTFETKLKEQDATIDDLYIKMLRKGYKPLKSNCKSNNSENQESDDQDVIILSWSNKGSDESSGGRMRAKFLHFCENYRPAYYGTWRKKCPQINGRRPYSKYTEFDYTVDSDDEWEEGEGESLAGTDDEKEEKDEVEEDYEEDDFLVPHGYLSESEEDEEDDQPMDPEALKARIAARQEEFKADRKAGLQKKKIVAVCSLGPDGIELQEEIKVLSQFKAVLMVATGLQPSWERENDIVINTKDAEPAVLTGKALELFCRTAHGFQGGIRALYDTFSQKWRAESDVKINVRSLKMTLTSYCRKSKSLNALLVDSQLVERFGLENLEAEENNDGTPHSTRFLPDDVIPDLIKTAQGNCSSSQIIEDFITLMADRKFGKARVKRTLANIGEFNSNQRCWLIKDEYLKEHGLGELKIEKMIKKEAKEEKTIKKDAKEEKTIKTKDSGKQKEPVEDLKNNDKENDDSKDSAKISVGESPRVESVSAAGTETTTPRRVSIKSFFTPQSKRTTPTTPTSSRAPSSSSAKIPTSSVLKETPPTAVNPNTLDTNKNNLQNAVQTPPKAKKRVQLTTLSRTPTLKEEKKSQAVLEKDEAILIEDSN